MRRILGLQHKSFNMSMTISCRVMLQGKKSENLLNKQKTFNSFNSHLRIHSIESSFHAHPI